MTNRIKARRKAMGWSRADLADRAGTNTSTLQLIELGHSHDDEAIARCEQALAEGEARASGTAGEA